MPINEWCTKHPPALGGPVQGGLRRLPSGDRSRSTSQARAPAPRPGRTRAPLCQQKGPFFWLKFYFDSYILGPPGPPLQKKPGREFVRRLCLFSCLCATRVPPRGFASAFTYAGGAEAAAARHRRPHLSVNTLTYIPSRARTVGAWPPPLCDPFCALGGPFCVLRG